MFQVGEMAVYGNHEVCQVTDIQERVVDKASRRYLVLKPVGHSGSQYLVPVGNEAAMSKLCPLACREELERLLSAPEIRVSNWIPDENKRKQFYRTLSGTSRECLFRTVCTLYTHRANQKAQGKRLHMCDENFLRDAEKMLSGEIEVVLGLSSPEALHYLRRSLGA